MPISGKPTSSPSDTLALAQSLIPERSDGEPLFHAPWEARIFALIVSLVRAGRLEWTTFQERLVRQIADRETAEPACGAEAVQRLYYECWLAAAEETLAAESLLEPGEVEETIAEIRRAVEATREAQRRTAR